MATRQDSLRGPDAPLRVPPAIATSGVLLGACAASLAIALLNQPYFNLVNGLVHAQGDVPRGLLFSSWLLLIGLPIVLARPQAFGFRAGSIGENWRLVTAVLAGAALVTAGILAATGPIPYSDASWFIEMVDVPITEELVYRGVLLTALVTILRRLHPARTALILAIVIDAVAFGIGHLANATTLDPGFVIAQATFATALGAACAFLMARTDSIYPAILLHAVVNGVVVAL